MGNSDSPLCAFRARHIATALNEAVRVQMSDEPAKAADMLRSSRFDQAPVQGHGHIEGWVLTAQLSEAANVKSVLRSLRDSAIVSAEASIGGVLQLLAKEGLVFTVADAGLAGFVTPSDLDRHAARSYFYLLISDVEMALAGIVRHNANTPEVVGRISDETRPRWMEAVTAG